MSKEIDALRNLIAAMDAEEKARRKMERLSEDQRTAPIQFDASGNVRLPADLSGSIEEWSKAFSDLNSVRGTAKYLIEKHDRAFAEAVARRPHQVKRECSDCDGEPGSCHMNCGPAVARSK